MHAWRVQREREGSLQDVLTGSLAITYFWPLAYPWDLWEEVTSCRNYYYLLLQQRQHYELKLAALIRTGLAL